MKNFMVANLTNYKRCRFDKLELLVKTQIANSLEVGWNISDIISMEDHNKFLTVNI